MMGMVYRKPLSVAVRSERIQPPAYLANIPLTGELVFIVSLGHFVIALEVSVEVAHSVHTLNTSVHIVNRSVPSCSF